MKTFTKESLIDELIAIRKLGWVKGGRPGNHGSVGNTIEDLLGIEENNLPIPNAAEWELKGQRNGSNSLTTLFHMEPSPRALKFIPKILLPVYGWAHSEAGGKYGCNEKSFRQTISSGTASDRGFYVHVNRTEAKVEICFDMAQVGARHEAWKNEVVAKSGTNLATNPYWGFDDLFHKAGTKLHNCFYLKADCKIIDGVEYFQYTDILMLSGFERNLFVDAIESGDVYVDFDARTGHNHGTKFRIRDVRIPDLYKNSKKF
jgi:hypothetical protein